MRSGTTHQQTVLGGARAWPKGGNPYHDPATGRFTTSSGSGDQQILTVTAPHGSSKPGRHWSTKDASVRVPDRIRGKVDQVAKDFNKSTNKDLVVTDGMRTPLDQAKRMLYKFQHGDFKTYRGFLGSSIAKIYREGIKNKENNDEILSKMSKEIDSNLKRGHPVSNH